MRLHEGTTLVACEIYPVTKTMGPSHAASRILPLRNLSTLPMQQSFGYRVLSKDGFLSVIKPRKLIGLDGFSPHLPNQWALNFFALYTAYIVIPRWRKTLQFSF